MPKTFSKLMEEIQENPEAAGLAPKSRGEKAFAALQGYPPAIKGPFDKAYPADETDDVLNAREMKQTGMHKTAPPVQSGETKPIPQGTSTLKDPSGFRGQPSRTNANIRAVAGDPKPVKTSPSAVATVDGTWKNTMKRDLKAISESVTSQLPKLASSGGTIKFSNGETAKIDAGDAKKLLDAMKKLNPDNTKRMQDMINSGPEGFMKAMKFLEGAK